MNIDGKKILFLGDSITEGVAISSIENVYWKLFEKNNKCIVKGYGISGTRIANQQVKSQEKPSFDKYFRSRISEMDEDADIIVVFGGTNDYGTGDAAIGKMQDRTDDTFYGALHNLFIDLIKKYTNSQIVVMTPCHRLNEDNYYNSRGLRTAGTLEDYVNIIIEVAGYYALPVLDLYRLSGLQPDMEEIKNKYMPDGLHPSEEGHKIIYNKLYGFLQSL